jgi:hypothetical protein
VIVGCDQASTILEDCYAEEEQPFPMPRTYLARWHTVPLLDEGGIVMQSLRRAAVATVKPRVSPSTWGALRNLDHGLSERVRRKPGRQEAGNSEKLGPNEDWDLVSLARYFGTDKWGAHRYAQHYEHHFGKFKHDDFTLFEIGIGGYSREKLGGASLRMWKAFFPKAQIIGLDLEDKSFVVEPRIATYQGSQTNEPLLRTIVSSAKNLRVIVDDGSHRPAHIRRTFEILFPLLPAGGLYAIEDTQTSYWPRYGGSLDLNDPSTTMGLAKRLVDGLNYEEWQDDDNKATAVDRNIVGVHCYHNLVIIEKGANNEGTNRGSKERMKPSQ